MKGKNELENERHEDYCQEYIIDFRRDLAYKRVYGNDFSKKTNITALARQIMKLDTVKERINYLKKQKAKKYKINTKYVLGHWVNIVEDDNERTHTKQKTLDRIAEYIGMLNQKVDINHSGKVDRNISVSIEWEKIKE